MLSLRNLMNLKKNMTFKLIILYAFSALMLSFVLIKTANGATVNLVWNANSETDLAGYKVHIGNNSGVYSQTHDVGKFITASFKLANRTFYCFAVTAYNTSGLESGYSNEVCYTTPKPGKGNQK